MDKSNSMYEELIIVFKSFGMNIEKVEKTNNLIFYASVPKTVELRISNEVISGKFIAEGLKMLLLDIIGGLFDDIKVRYKTREDSWSKDDTLNMIRFQSMQESMSEEKFTELINKLSEQIHKE